MKLKILKKNLVRSTKKIQKWLKRDKKKRFSKFHINNMLKFNPKKK